MKENRMYTIARLYVIPVLLMLAVLTALLVNRNIQRREAFSQAEAVLQASAREQGVALDMAFDSQFTLLEVFANTLSKHDSPDLDQVVTDMAAIVEKSDFDHMSYIGVDGAGVTDTGESFDAVGEAYFTDALAGQRALEDLRASGGSAIEHVVLAVPITNGDIRGVMCGSFNESALRELLVSEAYSRQGYSFVCNTKGDIVIGSNSLSFLGADRGLFDVLPGISMEDGMSAEKLASDLASGESGHMIYELDGGKRYTIYEPLDIICSHGERWFIFNALPYEVITEQVSRSTVSSLPMIFIVLFISVLIIGYVILSTNRSSRLMLVEREQLRMREEQFRIVVKQTDRHMFRYDIAKHTAYRDGVEDELFNMPEVCPDIPDAVLPHIAEESRPMYIDMFRRIAEGESPVTAICLMTTQNGEMRWYHFDSTTVFDDFGKPAQAVVSFYDVTDQREKEIVFEKWQQSLRGQSPDKYTLIECNLTKNIADDMRGELLKLRNDNNESSFNARTIAYASKYVHPDDRKAYMELLDHDSLVASYYRNVRSAVLEYRELTDTNKVRWLRLTIELVEYPDSSDIKAYLFYEDIDSSKKAELLIKVRSETDPLTGTLNRTSFVEQVSALLKASDPMIQHAFIVLDLDGFKHINDTLGHQAGDQVLIESTRRLRSIMRPGDLIGRLGGDEFMLCLKNIPYDDVVDRRAAQMCELLYTELESGVTVSVSMGIAMNPRDGASFPELYKKADIALYNAKWNGRNQYAFYRDDMRKDGSDTLTPIDEPITIEGEAEHLNIWSDDEERKSHILVVDDIEINRLILTNMFKDDYIVLQAENGEVAMRYLKRYGNTIAVVLLDIIMPVMDGLSVLKEMRDDSELMSIPVIVTSGADENEFSPKAIELGASEFLIKPIDPKIAKLRVQNAVRKEEFERLRVRNRYLLLKQSEEAAQQAHLRYINEHDPLTDIYNRTAFFRLTGEMLAVNPSVEYIMARFDVERFKVINDTFGHDEGDRLLRYIASHLENDVGSRGGTYCRIEADNFALCMPYGDDTLDYMLARIDELRHDYKLPFELYLPLGLYVVNDRTLSVDAMLDRASLAQRTIKGSYIRRFAFYDETLRLALLNEQNITSHMATALERGEFKIFLQPKCRLDTQDIVGAEALVRWFHPEKGIIPPSEFIPIFEKNGFIMQLDAYVWEEVCKLLRKWLDRNEMIIPITVSANISRVNIYNPNLCGTLVGLIKKYDIPRGALELEITESAYTNDPKQLASVIGELQKHGFIVQMDDFGSGYSSLNMLKDIPVDVLKLDMKFLGGSDESGRGASILTSVVRMARWLHLPVIAEGVETPEQALFLRNIGCATAQGYLFYKPMPVEEFEALMLNSPRPAPEEKRLASQQLINIDHLWSIDSEYNPLLNGVIGGFGLYELFDDNIEAIRVNDEYMIMFGTSIEKFYYMSTNVKNFVHPDDYGMVLAAFKRSMESHDIIEFEYRRMRDDGGYIWVGAKVRFLANEERRALFYVSLHDITARKLADARQARAQERYRILVEQTGAVVFEWDIVHDEFYAADEFYEFEMSRSTPEELLNNRGDPSSVHPDDMGELMRFFDALKLGADKAEVILRLKMTKGGYKRCRMAANLIRDPDNNKLLRCIGTINVLE